MILPPAAFVCWSRWSVGSSNLASRSLRLIAFSALVRRLSSFYGRLQTTHCNVCTASKANLDPADLTSLLSLHLYHWIRYGANVVLTLLHQVAHRQSHFGQLWGVASRRFWHFSYPRLALLGFKNGTHNWAHWLFFFKSAEETVVSAPKTLW